MSAPRDLWLVAQDPILGQAAQLLESALREAGVPRDTTRFATLPELARIPAQSRVIVAFGNEVCAHLVGEAWPDDGIQALRGYLWDAPCGRVLGSIHPATILSDWTPWRALLPLDLRRAWHEVVSGAPPLAEREVTVVTSPAQLSELHAACARSALVGADIENTHDLKLACMGFAPTPARAWVIPAGDAWQLAAIRELCEAPFAKAFQNGQYDRFFLQWFCGIAVRNHAFDTQLAWHALNPELAGKKAQVGHRKVGGRRTAKSLNFLSSVYTRDHFWKAYNFSSEDERYTLCGRDCCVTLDIALKQMAQLAVS